MSAQALLWDLRLLGGREATIQPVGSRQPPRWADLAAQEDDETAPDAKHIFTLDSTESLAEAAAPDCNDLVDHDLRDSAQAILRRRLDRHPKERRIDKRTRQKQDRGTVEITETVRLDDKSRPWLALISLYGDCDKIAAFHADPRARSSSAASRNSPSWASARSWAATSAACRLHSAANPMARVSDTQIWIGRKPAVLRLARRLLARALDVLVIACLLPVTCDIFAAPVQSRLPLFFIEAPDNASGAQ